jgi:hypothetical protein
VGDEGLEIGFERIAGDSRCPLGVFCIWEGDAAALIFAQKPAIPRASFELHTHSSFQRDAKYEGYKITLLAVVPYPEIDVEIDPNDYVVTVVVTDAKAPAGITTWGKIKALYD